ncbi:hypothetical protein F4824DRAFT_454604 [Ustulina deusta]|nr:hypothetical protein F4824DRAFT_454604 [Ustulina deusta]
MDSQISRLCNLILDYWAFVLQQDTCPLILPFGALRDSVTGNTQSSTGNLGDEHEGEEEDIINTEEVDNHTPSIAVEHSAGVRTTDAVQMKWNMTRFLLSEERDRLCLWEASIADKTLDTTTPGVEGPPNFLRVGILESLARIGQELLASTTGSCGDQIDIRCPVRKELENLVYQAVQTVDKTFNAADRWDDGASTMLTILDGSERGSAIEDQYSDLFTVLKASIEKLQSLTF